MTNQLTQDYHIIESFLFKGNRLSVPRTSLREKVIQYLHGGGFGGHFVRDKIIANIEERYYCPQLGKDVSTL